MAKSSGRRFIINIQNNLIFHYYHTGVFESQVIINEWVRFERFDPVERATGRMNETKIETFWLWYNYKRICSFYHVLYVPKSEILVPRACEHHTLSNECCSRNILSMMSQVSDDCRLNITIRCVPYFCWAISTGTQKGFFRWMEYDSSDWVKMSNPLCSLFELSIVHFVPSNSSSLCPNENSVLD